MKKNRLHIFIIIALIFTPITKSFSMWKSSSKLPLEIRLLAISLENTDENKQAIKQLDDYLQQIPIKSITFLLKYEFYQQLLAAFTLRPNNLLQTKHMSKIKTSYSPYTQWLIRGVISDQNKIKNNSFYPDLVSFIKMKKSIIDKQMILLKEQLLYNSSIIKHLSELEEQELELFFQNIMKKQLQSIINILAVFSHVFKADKTIQPKSFFVNIDDTQRNKEIIIDNDSAKILENLLPIKKNTTPSIKKAKIVSKEKKKLLKIIAIPTPQNKLPMTPPLYPTANPNYRAPIELPSSINDWNESEIDNYFN